MVDGLFLGDFFWKVVGTVRIHVSHGKGGGSFFVKY